MNQALAEIEASAGYVRMNDVETVMQALADRGYNSNNWQCLTEGYQVYWYREANRMILFNSKTNEIEYPEEYTVAAQGKNIFLDLRAANDAADGSYKKGDVIRHFEIYDKNYREAVAADFSLKNDNTSTISDLATFASSSNLSATAQTSLTSALTGDTTSSMTIKSALGLSSTGTVYVTASKTVRANNDNTGAYSSMQVMQVSNTEDRTLTSTGEVQPNLYYISSTIPSNATEGDKKEAYLEAGALVYNLFVQINEGDVAKDATILIAPGTKIDCSGREWKAVKYFEGYFGTTDSSDPVIIDGAKLSTATDYSQTVTFVGSSGKYFVTGFFATVYGNTTIENIEFKNISFQEPGSNYDMSLSSGYTRNTVSIIGGITDGDTDAVEGNTANVVLRNIKVDNTVVIESGGCAGGLVGYIGASTNIRALKGSILIEGCNISGKVTAVESAVNTQADVAGLIGFICRSSATQTDLDTSGNYSGSTSAERDATMKANIAKYRNRDEALFGLESNYAYKNRFGYEYWTIITVKDCTCTATINSQKQMGSVFCTCQGGEIRFEGTENDFSGVTKIGNGKKYDLGEIYNQSATCSFVTVPKTSLGSTQLTRYNKDKTTDTINVEANHQYWTYISASQYTKNASGEYVKSTYSEAKGDAAWTK